MYALIGAKITTKWELENVYTLDEALKLYALWCMSQDIEKFKMDEVSKTKK